MPNRTNTEHTIGTARGITPASWAEEEDAPIAVIVATHEFYNDADEYYLTVAHYTEYDLLLDMLRIDLDRYGWQRLRGLCDQMIEEIDKHSTD